MQKEYAKQVAAKIIEHLEQGTAPWQKPWKPGELSLPYNAATGKEYRGVNMLWLYMQSHADPRWMTFIQAEEIGAHVRRGSKGAHIVFWKFSDEKKVFDENNRPILDENGKQKTITVKLERPRVFDAVVFNASQVDGLPPLEPRQTNVLEVDRHARAETILSNSGANIQHVPGNRAYYSVNSDSIVLPERKQFDKTDAYYATALHELGHWTGHQSRLGRDLSHPFGSEGYAREELRAEIASLMLGERLDIGHDPSNHAAYVGSWIKVLKEDPREIFRAAASAEQIASYVITFEQEQIKQEVQISEHIEVAAVLHEQMENPMQSRTYLAVPYSEKNKAKMLGAKWDKEAKSWYAPEGIDVSSSGLYIWSLDNPNTMHARAPASVEVQFAQALKDAGLQIEDMPIMDGKMHRVSVNGDKHGATSGAYAGHLIGQTPGGFIQNYKTGEIVHWKPEGKINELTAQERARQAVEADQQRRNRETKRTAEHLATAAAAQALWDEAPLATAENDYCKIKGIVNPSGVGLRVVPEVVSLEAEKHGIKIAKTAQEAKALREENPQSRVFKAGDLLVPGIDSNGKLWTLQSINPYFKSFMKGGRKHGLFTIAGVNDPQKALSEISQAFPLVLAEGYATADAVSRLNAAKPVIVAFDSGNLDAVARELRELFPSCTLLIAADNDHNAKLTNVGLTKAKEVAKKYGGGVMVPEFNDGEKGSDWNDIAISRGDAAARHMLAEQMAVAKRDAIIAAEELTTQAHKHYIEAQNDFAKSAYNSNFAKDSSHADEVLSKTTTQLSDVNNMINEGMIANSKGVTGSPASVMSRIVHKTEAMHDELNEERQEPTLPKATNKSRLRSRDIEADI